MESSKRSEAALRRWAATDPETRRRHIASAVVAAATRHRTAAALLTAIEDAGLRVQFDADADADNAALTADTYTKRAREGGNT